MNVDRSKEINRCIELVKNECSHDAVYELHRLVGSSLRYIARKFLVNPEDTDDLVQEFWADIFNIAQGYKYTASGFNFLCKVMTNRALNFLRDKRNEAKEQSEYMLLRKVDEQISDREMTDKLNAKIIVEASFAKMNERQKYVISETFYLQKTVREIAAEMNVSKTLVYKIKMQAFKIIRATAEKFAEKGGQN